MTGGIPDPGRASKAVEMVVAGAKCPDPTKQQYRSQAEANRVERERRSRGNMNRLYPYECPCGDHWHLTHHTPEKQLATFNHDTHTAGLSAVSNRFEGHNVRHVVTDQPVWIGRDVCEAIGITKYRDALAQLDGDERVSVVVDTPGGPQGMAAVTEAGIYSLMFISRSEKVKPFKRWLAHEVLPAIRKTGQYGESHSNLALPDRKLLAQWVIEAETRAELAEAKVAVLEPPAAAWNELAEATGDYSVADAAKVLSRDAAIGIGQNRLFRFMHAEGWIFRSRPGTNGWCARQSQVDSGRLVEKLNRPYLNSRDEMITPAPTIRITPKGIAALHKLLGGGDQLAMMAVAE